MDSGVDKVRKYCYYKPLNSLEQACLLELFLRVMNCRDADRPSKLKVSFLQ